MSKLGKHIKNRRLEISKTREKLSQNKLSQLIDVEQSYLSKIERGVASKLSEDKILKLAEVLDDDPDYLLALGGKVSSDVLEIIQQRPMLFSRLVRAMKDMPEDVIEADHDFRQMQSRTSKLYELASVGFFHIESDEINSAWSSSCAAILGVPQSSHPSLGTIKKALSSSSQKEFAKAEKKARTSLKPFMCEVRTVGIEDSQRHLKVWGYHEPKTAEGDMVLLGLLQDVTEEVAARNEIDNAHQALSGFVKEQGQKLSQGIDDLKREIAARRLLESELRGINAEIKRQHDEQKNYLKQSTFELRTLISRLVSEGFDEDKATGQRGVLSFLSTTINNMNDYFSLKSGLSVFPEVINSKDFFDRLEEDVLASHVKNKVTLQFTASPHLPGQIEVDPQRVQQVVHSVVNILMQKTAWGIIQITVDYIEERDELFIAMSSSAATGDMSKETFYPTGAEKGRDTPWPVSTVGPIVDALGGSLSVSSAQNRGINISMQIPSRARSVTENPAGISPDQPVLVVEDDEYSRLYAKRLVEKSGFKVETASTGTEAMEKLQGEKFGLILLDIQLPDIDGVTIAQKVRSSSAWPNSKTSIVAVTAHGTSEDRQQYERVGIQRLIAKPFRKEELQELLAELYSKRKT